MTKKQTTDRVSRIAARLLAKYKQIGLGGHDEGWFVLAGDNVKWGAVAALAASVLSQDEVKGKRPAKRRRK